MINRKIVAAAVCAVAGSALVAGPAAAATKTLNIRGGSSFKPGGNFVDNHRFTPRTLRVSTGDNVRVVNRARTAQTGEPHTVTFVRRSMLPDSFSDFEGDSPLARLVGRLEQAHGEGEQGPTNPNVQDFQAVPEGGALQADGPGDSYFFAGRGGPTFQVTADRRSTLYYFCFIHPWMQGRIQVR